MTSSILSPDSQLLPNTAAVISLIPTTLGITAMLRPRHMLKLLHFPSPKDAEAQKVVDNLVRMFGGRDLALGLFVLAARYFGNREVLGWIMVAGSVAPAVDGWATRLQLGQREWDHWPFIVVNLALGGGMLGWFGGQ